AGRGDDGLHGGGGVGRHLADEPVASGPDRIRDVTALEFDPDAGARLGQERDADAVAGVGYARRRPPRRRRAEHGGHLRLHAERRGVDARHGPAVLAVGPPPHAVEQLEDGLLVDRVHDGPGPTALRTSTKRIVWASVVMRWRTLQT